MERHWRYLLGEDLFFIVEEYIIDKNKYFQQKGRDISQAIRFVEMCCLEDYNQQGPSILNEVCPFVELLNETELFNPMVRRGWVGKDYPKQRWMYYNRLKDYEDDIKGSKSYNYILRFREMCFFGVLKECHEFKYRYFDKWEYPQPLIMKYDKWEREPDFIVLEF